MTTTYMAKASEVDRSWWVVDATDVPLGRLATHVASVLRGKHKPTYTPHADAGDFVIVVNADRVKLTGNKRETKIHYQPSGHPGGLKERPYGWLLANKPEFVIEKAVRGMLPKNRLGRKLGSKLKVYSGAVHPHAAQKPEALSIQL
jgi:large subunit ribosomal protein L13